MKKTILGAAMTVVALTSSASATVIDFNNGSDLVDNFNVDIFQGDQTTRMRAAYGPQNGFDGSDGNFVHFDGYLSANSMQFINGPVFLNSFEISSQYDGNGAGVANATAALRDYTLELYDINLDLISSQLLLVGENGSWDTLNIGVNGVSAFRILSTANDGTGTGGWWANIDNVTFNVADVPEPAPLALLGLGLLGLGLARRRRG